MRIPDWYAPGLAQAPAFPKGWDAATLGDTLLNGKSLVTGGELALKIDPKTKKGANAAHPTAHGLDVAEFTLRVCVWTSTQMSDVTEAMGWLCPPASINAKGEVRVVRFNHPQLRPIINQLGRLDVIVKNTPAWVPSSVVPRGWEVTFKLHHWPAAARGAASGKSSTPARPTNVLLPPGVTGIGVLKNPLPTEQEARELLAGSPWAPPDYLRGGY